LNPCPKRGTYVELVSVNGALRMMSSLKRAAIAGNKK